MIVGTRKIVYSWPLLMLLAWVLGCGRTQSEIRAAQAPTSSLPLSDVVTDNNPHEPETFQPVPALSLPPVETQFIQSQMAAGNPLFHCPMVHWIWAQLAPVGSRQPYCSSAGDPYRRCYPHPGRAPEDTIAHAAARCQAQTHGR